MFNRFFPTVGKKIVLYVHVFRLCGTHSPGPYGPHLLRQTGHEQYEIGHGQAEQIVIGGRAHVLVFGDHHASDRVADDARHEYHRIHDGHRHDYVQRIPFDRHVIAVPQVFHARVQLAAGTAAAAAASTATAAAVVQIFQ